MACFLHTSRADDYETMLPFNMMVAAQRARGSVRPARSTATEMMSKLSCRSLVIVHGSRTVNRKLGAGHIRRSRHHPCAKLSVYEGTATPFLRIAPRF